MTAYAQDPSPGQVPDQVNLGTHWTRLSWTWQLIKAAWTDEQGKPVRQVPAACLPDSGHAVVG